MTPCTLCWYQRIFMFPIAIILGIACFTDDRQGAAHALALAFGRAGHGRLPHPARCRTDPQVLGALQRRSLLRGPETRNPQWRPDTLAVTGRVHGAGLPSRRIPQKVPPDEFQKITVSVLIVIVLAFFFFGMNAYQKRVQDSQAEGQSVRKQGWFTLPFTGLRSSNASVTIVSFDPACETCRAFYPIVKRTFSKQYPHDVRLVIRYAPFHPGSDRVVKLLEAAKRQDKYLPVLEMVLATQPQWADHGKPTSIWRIAQRRRQVWISKRRKTTLRHLKSRRF